MIQIVIKVKSFLAIDFKTIKDEFDKIRYEINQRISEIETHLVKREEFQTMNPNDVLQKNILNDKIESGLAEVQTGLGSLELTLKAQKNKPKKYGDISHKEEMFRLMNERFQHLRNKHEGVPVDERKEKDNLTALQKLDIILEVRKSAQQEGVEEREMYQEEKDAIDNFNRQIEDQEKGLDELKKGVVQLKSNVKEIGKGIDNVGKAAKAVSKQAAQTEKKLETTNAKLKDLLSKIRSGDRICVDIVLICVCLGLIAVLYNIIKSNFFDKETTNKKK